MLNVDLLPESLVKFVKEFNTTVPNVEKMNVWWEEANAFLTHFDFPTMEIEEDFYRNQYNRANEFIKSINADPVAPMSLMLNGQYTIYAFTRGLLVDKIDWTARLELDAYATGEFEAVKHMSISALSVYIEKILEIKPVGSVELYLELLDRYYSRPLHKWVEHIFQNPGDVNSLRTLAGAIAKHRYFATCETELLKHHLKSRTINLAPDQLRLTGLKSKELSSYIGLNSSSRDLEVYKALEAENLAIKAGHVPRRYTVEELERMVNHPVNPQEAETAAAYLYNSVNNISTINKSKLRRDIEAERYSYASTPEGLKEHYSAISSDVQRDLVDLFKKVNDRRAKVVDSECYQLLTEIAENLKLTSDNFINFKSKRSWKHTDGLIRSLQFSLSFILALPEKEMLLGLEALKLDRLHLEANQQSRCNAFNGGFAGE
jgi:hypothetical protein